MRLAWSIVREQLSADEILEKLSEIGEQFPIAKAVANLRKKDCYTAWQRELRYFSYRYEEHLARKAGLNYNNEQWNRIWLSSAADSIEHVLAKKEDKVWVHWLGNLIMLPPGLNSKLGAKPPKEKACAYTKTGLLVAQEVVDSLPKWRRRAIEERETALLQWALEEWGD